MLSIRLSRAGTKKRPYYHIVVAEKSAPRDGRFVESIGTSNPVASGQDLPLTLNMERYQHWYQQGARPSETVKRLVRLYQRTERRTEA